MGARPLTCVFGTVETADFECFAFGLRWGALGVVIAFALAVCVIFWYPTWRLAGPLIDLSFSEAMQNLRGPFVCVFLMALGVLALRLALCSALLPAIRLPLSILTGACLYIGALQMYPSEQRTCFAVPVCDSLKA
jgi:hypothetical protein